MPDWMFALIFSGLFVASYAGGRWWLAVRRRGPAASHDAASLDAGTPPPLGAWTEALAAQIPQFQTEAEGLERDLRRAGRYAATARRDFLAVRNALTIAAAIAAAAVLVWLGPLSGERTFQVVVAGITLSALAFVSPRLRLKLAANARVRRIERGLSDALDMISMCMSGGLSFQAALTRVGSELRGSHPELALELAIIRRQAGVSSLGQALGQFARRVDGPEVKTMTLLVTQAERLGTDVVSALREYADGLRRSHRQRAEERANKTGIRLLFPLVLCLMPSVFLLLWGPALLELRDFLRSQAGPGSSLADEIESELAAPPRP